MEDEDEATHVMLEPFTNGRRLASSSTPSNSSERSRLPTTAEGAQQPTAAPSENGGLAHGLDSRGFDSKRSGCRGLKVILLLLLVILVQTTALVYLILHPHTQDNSTNSNSSNSSRTRSSSNSSLTDHKFNFKEFGPGDLPFLDSSSSNSSSSSTPTTGEKSTPEHWSYFLQPRCFSMCESPDLFYRDDKLMKTVVTYSQYGEAKLQPSRYYMFLFPDAPVYDEGVGSPLYLTPLIEAGKLSEARELSLVSRPEGVSYPSLQLESYSGLITVNSTANSNMFFWFFPAEASAGGNRSETPVVLWLQGGPGATGLYGMLKEHGPFTADVNENGEPFTRENPYRWSGNHSVIYIDNPVGTGFSFTEDPADYPAYIEDVSDDLYSFLQQFFRLFPEYVPAPFYAFGESYGGKYAPSIAWKIHQENQNLAQGNIRINLAGIGVGNGWMSPGDQGRYASYLMYHGLLDKIQFAELDRIDDKIIDIINQEDWTTAWQYSDEQLNYVLTALNFSNLYDLSQDQYRPSTMNFWYWVEQESVRKSLHVGNLAFSDGLEIYMAMVGDTMRSVKSTITNVLKNYKVLAYNGALDIICHYPGVETMFSTTDWPGKEEFNSNNRNSWWAYNQDTQQYELAGYVKRGGNLRLVLVRNAGHSVPLKQPQWSLRLLEDFTSGKL